MVLEVVLPIVQTKHEHLSSSYFTFCFWNYFSHVFWPFFPSLNVSFSLRADMCLCFNWLHLYLAAHSGHWNMQSAKSNVPYRNRVAYELKRTSDQGQYLPLMDLPLRFTLHSNSTSHNNDSHLWSQKGWFDSQLWVNVWSDC